MVAAFVRNCSSRVDCICLGCKNKKQKLELNKFKIQNPEMCIPQLLQQLSVTEWKTRKQLAEELNIDYSVVCRAIKWLIKHEPKLLEDKQCAGKDFRLVKVYSLAK